MNTALIIVAIASGVADVVARVIPSVNNWAPTHIIISALKWISDMLNNQKK